MMRDTIKLQGVRVNNLKNIDLYIPKEKIVVFTGISGSGKSSILFDTIAQESRRQMTGQYNHYIRNQMPSYERPDADLLENLSPVVVIDQKPLQTNHYATIATYMEIDPLLRLLYSRIGKPKIGESSHFSPWNPQGKCPTCNGYGQELVLQVDRMIDHKKSLEDGAIQFKPFSPSNWQGRWMITGGLFDPSLPIEQYSKEDYNLLIYGPEEGEEVYAPFHTKNGPQPHKWDGLIPRFYRLYIHRDITKLKQVSMEEVLAMTEEIPCSTCHGTGYNPAIFTCKINDYHLLQMLALPVNSILEQLQSIHDPIGKQLVQQIIPPLQRLQEIGLAYLSLDRTVDTLSSGEAQRLKIARQLGTSLNNMIYILDEPTASLHKEEVAQLMKMIQALHKKHNTILLVEHDETVMEMADHIIEIGPGAGRFGGEIVYEGTFQSSMRSSIDINNSPKHSDEYFMIHDATVNNLQSLHLSIPIGLLVSICGVSGSGKTSLLHAFTETYKEAIYIRKEAIGASSRSTVATYMGIMDTLRNVFAKLSGKSVGLFSFNSTGACPVCHGKGVVQPDVAFADPITIVCETCHGTRYREEALRYTYAGYNIVQMLQMTVEEAKEIIQNDNIQNSLDRLIDVGLDYVMLGETTSSLSGGESQRLKLASYLQEEGNIYVLDEPSVGLHAEDRRILYQLFRQFVERGNTVIMAEHQLDMIAKSDYVVELGPGAGENGGQLLFSGTPEQLYDAQTTTAKWLRKKGNI